jgi:hypothetical protein
VNLANLDLNLLVSLDALLEQRSEIGPKLLELARDEAARSA